MHRISALGDIRIFDVESGEPILEGKLSGITFRDEKGDCWKIKRIKPKKCPHCGKELKEADHGDPKD